MAEMGEMRANNVNIIVDSGEIVGSYSQLQCNKPKINLLMVSN